MWPTDQRLFSWRYLLNHPVLLCFQLFFFSFFLKGIIAISRESENHKKLWRSTVLFFLFAIPVFLFIMNALGFRNTYVERSAYVGMPFFLMVISRGAVSESKAYLSLILVSGLVIIISLSTFGLFKQQECVYCWTLQTGLEVGCTISFKRYWYFKGKSRCDQQAFAASLDIL